MEIRHMAKLLKTETNTARMARRIELAFNESDEAVHHENNEVFFEHGQHWACCKDCGAQWSVCDSEGYDAIDGFTFEQVSHGDETCYSEAFAADEY